MSKEVKRYVIGHNGLPEFSSTGEFVAYSDYEALLAERDAAQKVIEEVLHEMRERRVNHGKYKSPTLIAWADRIDAALQGEQP